MCLIRVGAELCRTVATFNVAELQRHILVWHVYYIVLSHFSGFVCTQIFLETNTCLRKNGKEKDWIGKALASCGCGLGQNLPTHGLDQ